MENIIKYRIRIILLDIDLVNKLSNILLNNSINYSKNRIEDCKINIVFELTENFEKNKKILKEISLFASINMFVSFTSDKEITGFTIPNDIFALIKYLETIDISVINLCN